MPCITYQDIKIQGKSRVLIDRVNQIIKEYQAQGYALTLRQVYYQLVSRNIIENTESSYKRIGEQINTGRLAGIIDWTAIEDRTRNLRALRGLPLCHAPPYTLYPLAGEPFKTRIEGRRRVPSPLPCLFTMNPRKAPLWPSIGMA